jgi:hypothetical protein
MAYVLVLLLAAAAGVAVGVATYRTGQVPASGPTSWSSTYEPATLEADTPTGSQAQADERNEIDPTQAALPGDPNARSRLVGALGLLVVILLAAGAVVGVLYVGYLSVKGVFGG